MSVLVVLAATAAPATLGAASRPAIYGVWTAAAGVAAFHGEWSAQALPESPNSVIGSWTLLNDGAEVTMQGTWSAKRLGRDWRGTWQAKVRAGATLSGSWQAVLPDDLHGKTFEELLRATDHLQISGSWKSRGGAAGAWWLKPPAP